MELVRIRNMSAIITSVVKAAICCGGSEFLIERVFVELVILFIKRVNLKSWTKSFIYVKFGLRLHNWSNISYKFGLPTCHINV